LFFPLPTPAIRVLASIPMSNVIRVGVRGNKLGVSIGQQILDSLSQHLGGATVEILEISDPGRRMSSPWPGSALERSLAQGDVQMVIQNAKDASPAAPGITIAAVTARFTPFDVLITSDESILDELPEGSALSAHTALRRAQLLNYRPDFRIVDFAGSLEERIHLLEKGEVDGLIVSASGVEHLGMQDRVSEIFTTEVLVPAPGQGSAVIQVRTADKDFIKMAKHCNDVEARAEFDAERAFLKALGADSRAPVGALAQGDGASLRLEGVIAERDGSRLYRDFEIGGIGSAASMGERLAKKLIAEGGHRALATADTEQ
jgi:hydroxymethylbilane synthase